MLMLAISTVWAWPAEGADLLLPPRSVSLAALQADQPGPAGADSSGAPGQPRPLLFSCRTTFYEQVKELLIPGDAVYAFCARSPGRRPGGAPAAGRWAAPEPVWHPELFQQALAALENVRGQGLVKALVFSSCADLEREIARLPEDIALVSYNTERGMTPAAELQDLPGSVQRFAQIAHDHGRQVAWGPTHIMLTSNPDLLDLARYVDSLGLQLQRPLQAQGLDAFVQLARERSRRIKAANPRCQVTVQVVLERTPAEQAAAALRAVADVADRVTAWTMRDVAGLRQVLEACATSGRSALRTGKGESLR
ncbi:MAG: hypothetical protein J7M26_02415 [Armatimonadetes bacterium]|nr:hypothetical protein [Armatimonadota bacterium]